MTYIEYHCLTICETTSIVLISVSFPQKISASEFIRISRNYVVYCGCKKLESIVERI